MGGFGALGFVFVIEFIRLFVIPQSMSRMFVGIRLLRARVRARWRGFTLVWRVESVVSASAMLWTGVVLPRAMSYIRDFSSNRSLVMFWSR